MPGGRSTIVDIALALNLKDAKKREEYIKFVKCAVDKKEYSIVQTSMSLVAAAISVCDHEDDLNKIWMYLIDNQAVSWTY